MKSILANIDEPARRTIVAKLHDIANCEEVEHLIAVESGSRAWGFPSPDSDYDVRFIYMRPRNRYLSLATDRDVIDRPIVDDFDVNGWDIRKALQLLLKHNAVVSEWINSPIRYLEDHPSVGLLSGLIDEFFDPHGYAMHYASLAKSSAERWVADAQAVSIKKYFYALRPALAVRAIRLNPGRRPPMALPELLAATDLPSVLETEICEMVELKSSQREAAAASRSDAIERLVMSEIERAGEVSSKRRDTDFRAALDAYFVALVDAE